MKIRTAGSNLRRAAWTFLGGACLLSAGCFHHAVDDCGAGGLGGRRGGPPYDRPFPLGAVTDSHWETQQTNAEAADFIFYDHEFVGETAQLAPGGKKHLEEIVLRLEHVPFPVAVEQSPYNAKPELDQQRRQTIVEQLARLGVPDSEGRVVIASAFAEGVTGIEAERAYYNAISNQFGYGFGGGVGGRFGGRGGTYR